MNTDNPVPRPGVWRRRVLRSVLFLVLLVAVVVGLGALWLRSELRGSLPQLDGELALDGLTAAVVVERDARGVPTLRGEHRIDLSRALGFLHGQERFFQMDLLRRASAGELAELVGPAALRVDRSVRVHRFRHRAEAILADAPADQLAHFEAYAAGVNAGLAALDANPFEYLALRSDPKPWSPVDSVLVVFAMYLDLQGNQGQFEANYGVLHDVQPELFDFLANRGSAWDAPIEGEIFETPPIPGPDAPIEAEEPAAAAHLDLGDDRFDPATSTATWPWDPFAIHPDGIRPGSNNWAVAGRYSKHGGALVANDMHLGLRVPNIWFRASLVYPVAGGERRITGVTLPGAMVVIAGSNGRVAWGYTNSACDWGDLVVLELAGDGRYQTPEGPRPFEVHSEILRANDGSEETLEVRETVWGPVIDTDHQGRERAFRWVAHDRRAINLGLLEMEDADTIEDALAVAAVAGTPAQNLMLAADDGRIAWTILGPIPRRKGGYDSRVPTSWADGSVGWDGWLDAEERPRVVDPEIGRLWTANSRVVGGAMYDLLGDGGYDLGARTGQIRDDLLALETADESDMLAVQLDDRALFLASWRDLLIATLDGAPEGPVDAEVARRRAEARRLLDDTWTGRAEPSSVAYRLARAFRIGVHQKIFDHLTAPSKTADERFDLRHLRLIEGPIRRLIEERPDHFLDPQYESWDAWLLAAADAQLETLEKLGPLETLTWGAFNRVTVAHPLSRFLPEAARPYLDMPTVDLPGDAHMPRVQRPGFGASERFAVSPGREDEGYFHMPTGQSGHPLSPFYRDGQQAWVEGEPTPFLPGPAAYTLRLVP